MALRLKVKEAGMKPNTMLLNSGLEAAMRMEDTDFMYDCLNDFVE